MVTFHVFPGVFVVQVSFLDHLDIVFDNLGEAVVLKVVVQGSDSDGFNDPQHLELL